MHRTHDFEATVSFGFDRADYTGVRTQHDAYEAVRSMIRGETDLPDEHDVKVKVDLGDHRDPAEVRASALARQLADFVNGGGSKQFFSEALNREHPTLQQAIGRLFVDWLESVHKQDGRFFDLRNEDLKRFADAVFENCEVTRPYMRFI